MVAEGGFDLRLEPAEFASALDLVDAGRSKVVTKIQDDVPIIYLYRTKHQLGVSNRVGQVRMYSDYIVRLETAGFVE